MGSGLSVANYVARCLNFLLFVYNLYGHWDLSRQSEEAAPLARLPAGALDEVRFSAVWPSVWERIVDDLGQTVLRDPRHYSMIGWDFGYGPDSAEFRALFSDDADGAALLDWTWEAFHAWWSPYQRVLDRQSDVTVGVLYDHIRGQTNQANEELPDISAHLLVLYDRIPDGCRDLGPGFVILSPDQLGEMTAVARAGERLVEVLRQVPVPVEETTPPPHGPYPLHPWSLIAQTPARLPATPLNLEQEALVSAAKSAAQRLNWTPDRDTLLYLDRLPRTFQWPLAVWEGPPCTLENQMTWTVGVLLADTVAAFDPTLIWGWYESLQTLIIQRTSPRPNAFPLHAARSWLQRDAYHRTMVVSYLMITESQTWSPDLRVPLPRGLTAFVDAGRDAAKRLGWMPNMATVERLDLLPRPYVIPEGLWRGPDCTLEEQTEWTVAVLLADALGHERPVEWLWHPVLELVSIAVPEGPSDNPLATAHEWAIGRGPSRMAEWVQRMLRLGSH